jgi:hypothetical protein
MTCGAKPLDFRAGIRLSPFFAVVLVAAGCGQRTYPVTLSFSLADGSPLTDGFVAVQHTADSAILGGGPIAADGTCRPLLRGQSNPGLPAGTYRLGVTGSVSSDFDAPPPPPLFDSVFMDPSSSGLTFTVGPGAPERPEFSLGKQR